jgi:predicted SnoaL-like aldol condensation-catalyzing enzyme
MKLNNNINKLILSVSVLLASQWALAQPSLAPPHAPIVAGEPVPVTIHPDQQILLLSTDAKLAANKKVVYDMYREVIEAGHAEAIDKYYSSNYKEYSQVRLGGRAGLKQYVNGLTRLEEIPTKIEGLVTLLAEGSWVVLAQISHYLEPDGSGNTYSSTYFDVYHLTDAKIDAHYDSQQLGPNMKIPSPEEGGPLPIRGVAGLAQHEIIMSDNPSLLMNKRLAFDVWRNIPEAGREEMADLYLDPIYVQHNPNAATGRDGFKEYFAKRPDSAIDTFLEDEIITVVAEGDLVVQVLQEERPHPDTGETYYVAWVDMFRMEGGRIFEHWDTASKGELPESMQKK